MLKTDMIPVLDSHCGQQFACKTTMLSRTYSPKLADGFLLPEWLHRLLFVVSSYFRLHGWDVVSLCPKVEISHNQGNGWSFNTSHNIELTVPLCRGENEVSKSKGQRFNTVLPSCCYCHWHCWPRWWPCKTRPLSLLWVIIYKGNETNTSWLKDVNVEIKKTTTATKVCHKWLQSS